VCLAAGASTRERPNGGAAGLAYRRVGAIPAHALKPHGGLTGTITYFKPFGAAA
jgi:hypothetical protein